MLIHSFFHPAVSEGILWLQVPEDSAQTELAKPVSDASDLKIPKVKFHPEIYSGGLRPHFSALLLVCPSAGISCTSEAGSPHADRLAQSTTPGGEEQVYVPALSPGALRFTHMASL